MTTPLYHIWGDNILKVGNDGLGRKSKRLRYRSRPDGWVRYIRCGWVGHYSIYGDAWGSCYATVIPPRKDPIPSELGSQTWLGQTSSGLRDHLRISGAVVFCF